MRFDHIGITTTSLDDGRRLLAAAAGVQKWTAVYRDEVNDVRVQFGCCSAGVCYELVAPLSPRSPISRALAQRVNTLNHLAYLVDDLAASGAHLVDTGFVPVGPARPAIAYKNSPIQFFVSESRLLIELIEAAGHRHSYIDAFADFDQP
jgi:methylmalonyl-CoA/ethylmalonyl-CoA epimerase